MMTIVKKIKTQSKKTQNLMVLVAENLLKLKYEDIYKIYLCSEDLVRRYGKFKKNEKPKLRLIKNE